MTMPIFFRFEKIHALQKNFKDLRKFIVFSIFSMISILRLMKKLDILIGNGQRYESV